MLAHRCREPLSRPPREIADPNRVIGTPSLHRFTGIPDSTIKVALAGALSSISCRRIVSPTITPSKRPLPLTTKKQVIYG